MNIHYSDSLDDITTEGITVYTTPDVVELYQHGQLICSSFITDLCDEYNIRHGYFTEDKELICERLVEEAYQEDWIK